MASKAIHSGLLTTTTTRCRFQGFRSAAQVPASYFEHRKRVRVRVANILAATPPISNAPGHPHHRADVRGEGAREGALLDPTISGKREMERHRGSDGEIGGAGYFCVCLWRQVLLIAAFKRGASAILLVLQQSSMRYPVDVG